MGASSSVAIFEYFSTAIQWVLEHKLGFSEVSQIIDDFIFIGSPNTHECHQSLQNFIALAEDIGIPIKTEKRHLSPLQCLKYTCLLWQHCYRQTKLLNQTNYLDTMKKTLCKHFNLSFACNVVKPRRFLRRLNGLIKGQHKTSHQIKLNKDCSSDLTLWYNFLEKYSGCILPTDDRFISLSTLHPHTDAASSIGFALRKLKTKK